MAGNREVGFNDRTHFLAVASRVMRQVLVDYARARSAKKRAREEQGDLQPLTTGIRVQSREPISPVDLLDLDAALDALAREDGSLAKLIEMRYFGGMTAEKRRRRSASLSMSCGMTSGWPRLGWRAD